VRAKREAWFDKQLDFDPERLVFLDECGTNTKMARLYGRSRRGQRCRAPIPHGHWKTTTLVAALTVEGIVAPMVLDGAMDGEMFKAYIARILAPILRPGDIVIWDNLPAHRVSGVADIIEKVGAQILRLPPYSPDFNPIEMAFSKLKALLRKAAARTREELDDAIANAIEKYTEDQCANYFKACGYEPE